MKGFWTGKTPSQKVKEGVFRGTDTGDPCIKCGLYKGVNSPRMAHSGKGRLGILAIGEAPGKTEDEKGIQFIGEAGKLLENYLRKEGISLHDDLWLINAVNCRPPKNRTPTATEINCCRHRVHKVIKELKPKFIWLIGETAVKSFYSGRFSDTSIGRWHKLCIPDKDTDAWIIPMYHPSFALRASNDKNKVSAYERDLEFALLSVNNLRNDKPVFVDPTKRIRIIKDYKELREYLLLSYKKWDSKIASVSFDYEASNLKPYYGDQRYIWSCSFSDCQGEAVAFPIEYTGHFKSDEIYSIKLLLREIFENYNIGKIAHNLPFEDLWTREVIKAKIESWLWCTMNAAHVIDCRKGFNGLKFQAYINYGIEGYGDEASTYMNRMHKGTQVNMLDTMPLNKLLLYNGIDTLITGWLYDDQIDILKEGDPRRKAFDIITMPGLLSLSESTAYGISMDAKYYSDETNRLNKQLKLLEKKLLNCDTADKFRENTGRRLRIVNKDFSAKDLRIIMYDILKAKSSKETKTGLKAVDKEIVADIKHPWAKTLVKWRTTNKLVNTYMAQFAREISNDGRMHPWFHMHTTRTYRSSSSKPNFQNIPNRDEEAKIATRKGMMPSKGRRIGAIDQGSFEVRNAAFLSNDKKLIWYCSQDKSDMHMDVSTKVWNTTADNIPGDLRFHIKSGFVFAEMYGSYYVNCALKLWELCSGMKLKNGKNVITHLKDIGIIHGKSSARTKYKIKGRTQTISKHLAQFIEHIKDIENWFWSEFHGLREWQEKIIKNYQKNGYVEMPFGFRRTDLLSNNKIINSIIQGTAFHLLMWAYIELNKYCNNKWETEQLGQIHDEIVFDIVDSELQEVLNTSQYIMTKQIREEFDWITVPLVIEPKVTEIDTSWVYKKEMVRDEGNNLWVFKD